MLEEVLSIVLHSLAWMDRHRRQAHIEFEGGKGLFEVDPEGGVVDDDEAGDTLR
jgi:hypothetical protein